LNTSMARKYKRETTANAGLIMPRAWNIHVKPGDYSKEELFSEVKRGIYITNVWYTRFQNYVKGDFSTIPRDGAFLIENGEITKPIRNIRVSDNMQHILEGINALGKELYHIHWWEVDTPVFTPYVLVKDVGITKATK
ncbi:metallopeptidase TldD-related protein, partial [Palaeococcus sp. (in: euryarchaeotes)]